MSASSSNVFSLYGRLLRKVVVYKDDVLAVSDRAFYLLTNLQTRRRVYRRGTLTDLIRDKKTRNTEFVKAFVERIKSLSLPLLVVTINALYSDSLAEKLFMEVNKVMDLDGFVSYITEYGKKLSGPFMAVSRCRIPKKDEPPPTVIYTPFVNVVKLLEALGISVGFGIHDGVPCIVLSEKSEEGISLAAEE